MTGLAERREGDGPPVLLLHGGLLSGDMAWTAQSPLAERWTLVRVDRVGYGASAGLGETEDFDRDTELLAPALETGTHLVGWSSGGVAAMLVAARRPDAVASLTLIEPPVFHVAADSAAARELLHRGQAHWARQEGDEVEWVRDFFALFGTEAPPDEVLDGLRDHARAWRGIARRPWDVHLPLGPLAAARFPKLVLSGGYSDGFEDVCDVLAARLGAERDVIEGAGHAVQMTGAPFNERLERLLGASP
ncbi:MAG TPA: alpha/beta hydrolase [Solirubrobacteraceae bacterium]|nr:alpha/beta hydrolase [Solirubrobacteraceae bacterium]